MVVDAPGHALQGQVSAPRPAQPSQARRRRRPRGVHGIAEPHRPHLRLAQEHQARPAVAGAHDAADRPGRGIRQRRLPLRLDDRDRRAPRDRARARGGARPQHLARRAASARSCRADPATRPRTTCGCSSRSSTARPRRSSSRARTSCPTRRWSTRSPRPASAVWRCSCSSPRSATRGSSYHAQRSYYSDLLEAGVRIFLYPAPYILHAKHLSIDDDIAFIGSSNMDIRSFSLNAESSLLVRGESFVARDARGRAGIPGCRSRAHPRAVAQGAAQGHVLRRPRAAHLCAQLTAEYADAALLPRHRDAESLLRVDEVVVVVVAEVDLHPVDLAA